MRVHSSNLESRHCPTVHAIIYMLLLLVVLGYLMWMI